VITPTAHPLEALATSLTREGGPVSTMLGGNPSDVITRNQRIEAVTPAAVQDVFRKYFPVDRYTVVTLVPEKQ
jgi:hypothetical protein